MLEPHTVRGVRLGMTAAEVKRIYGPDGSSQLKLRARTGLSQLHESFASRGRDAGARDRAGTMKWSFEPGHTAAEFGARHMMVTWVRGSFKDVHGTLEFDPADPRSMKVHAVIDAAKCWSGESARDAHLRSDDFLGCESYPQIRFTSTNAEQVAAFDYKVAGDLTIRGITRPVVLDVHFLGTWQTPWWEDGADKGPKTRAGFLATTRIDRYDFGVNWNGTLPNGGFIVGRDVDIALDAEAILEG